MVIQVSLDCTLVRGIKQQVSNTNSLSWSDVDQLCQKIVTDIESQSDKITNIIAVSRGGLIPGTILSHMLNVERVYCFGMKSYSDDSRVNSIPSIHQPLTDNVMWTLRSSTGSTLIVDDISDTGDTFSYIRDQVTSDIDNTRFVSLCLKHNCKLTPRYFGKVTKKWIVFPWELNNDV
mgnify:CR=1 FL=1